jgi:hypothetical protein
MSDFTNVLTRKINIDGTIYNLYKEGITRLNHGMINYYIDKMPSLSYLYYKEIIDNICENDLYDTYTVMIFLCQKYILYNENTKYDLPLNLAYPTYIMAKKLNMPFGLSYYTYTLCNYKLDVSSVHANRDILDDIYHIYNITPIYIINHYSDDDDMNIRSCVMVEYLGYKIYTYLLVINSMTERELFDFCFMLLNILYNMEYYSYKPYNNPHKNDNVIIEANNIIHSKYEFNCNNKIQSVYIQIISYILGIDIKQSYFVSGYYYMPAHHKHIINNIHRFPTLEMKVNNNKISYLYKKCLEEFQYFAKKYINNIDFDNIISHKISLISRKNKQSYDIISSNNIINKYCVSCLLLCIFIYWISYYLF